VEEQNKTTGWTFPENMDESVANTHYGFVYLITNIETGRMYVGRKYFTRKNGKRRVASDWKTYFGSCKPLLAEITEKGSDKFKREILNVYKSRNEVNYGEVEEQVKRNVLKALLPDGSRAYYNGNILNRWFVAKEEKSPETKANMAVASKARAKRLGSQGYKHLLTDEHRAATSRRNIETATRYEYKDKSYTVAELVELTGLKRRTIFYRINKGWSIAKIIETPASFGNDVRFLD
jgi:hypothetical protein